MKSNEFWFRVFGRYALFTDPASKVGGEKSSFQIPSYQALKGICESIYFKPSIRIYIDEAIVLNPIQTETKGIRPIKYGGGNDLCYYTYLRDPDYAVKAHFEFNLNRPELADDFNENKHYFIMKRSIERGGRRDSYLGTRECQAYVEPLDKNNLPESYYKDTEEMSFGLSYHSLSYPDENGSGKLIANFWYPKMEKGVIKFCRPEDCPKKREVKNYEYKIFKKGENFSGLDEEGILDGYSDTEGCL